jgi:hypothetical protein
MILIKYSITDQILLRKVLDYLIKHRRLASTGANFRGMKLPLLLVSLYSCPPSQNDHAVLGS